jgi:predicted GNAT family acetyltransferase
LIREVTAANVDEARAFLERRAETALFLLSNLAAHGPRAGEALSSGDFRLIEENGQIAAVFCLTVRGNLLSETAGRADFAEGILNSCEDRPIRIRGVVGEWRSAEAIWRLLTAKPGFTPTRATKEFMFGLELAKVPPVEDSAIRLLTRGDFEVWHLANAAYMLEEKMPVQGTVDQQRAQFERQTDAGHWWGTFDGGRLAAMVALNAVYGTLGQVGGVYTPPEWRRKGLARSAMRVLISDAARRLALKQLTLFTGENNLAAQGLYESLGFRRTGDFGLFFGSWR